MNEKVRPWPRFPQNLYVYYLGSAHEYIIASTVAVVVEWCSMSATWYQNWESTLCEKQRLGQRCKRWAVKDTSRVSKLGQRQVAGQKGNAMNRRYRSCRKTQREALHKEKNKYSTEDNRQDYKTKYRQQAAKKRVWGRKLTPGIRARNLKRKITKWNKLRKRFRIKQKPRYIKLYKIRELKTVKQKGL